MINETQENVVTTETETDYIQAINDIKANSVPKEQYMKLKNENSKLLDAIVNGQEIEVPKKEPTDIAKLRTELYGSGQTLSNLDYWTKTLQLRDAIIAGGKPDPFCPQGKNIIATEEDKMLAKKVADTVQHCIDIADGDNLVFTNELQRLTVDTAPIRRK